MKIKDTYLEIQEENEELCARIEFLQTENTRLLKELRDVTDTKNYQKRQIAALKFRCSDLRKTVTALEEEVADMKFTKNFLNSDEAGKMFARSLGVGQ